MKRAVSIVALVISACGDDDAAVDVAKDAGSDATPPDAAPPLDATAGDAKPDAPEKCPPTTDYQNDFRNCGRCGHDCYLGACSEGICQPYKLTSKPTRIRELIVRGSFIFYTDESGQVTGYPIGDETNVILALNQGLVRSLATDGAFLYWLSEDGTSISRCAVTGCNQTPTVVVTGLTDARSIAWDPSRSRIVWAEHTAPCDPNPAIRGAIGSALADGGDPKPLVPDAGSHPSNVATTANALYWTVDRCSTDLPQEGSLFQLAQDGGRITLRTIPDALEIPSLYVDDAGTSFTATDAGAFANTNDLVVANPLRIATDDTYVYFTSGKTNLTLGWRHRSAGSGPAEVTIVRDADAPMGAIGVDKKNVYFALGNAVMAMTKP